MIAYVDSSLFLKLIFLEDGTPAAEEIWDGNSNLVTSRLMRVETRAALACEVSESTQLRSLEAIHMASALVVGAGILASADSEMCSAARNFGISVANPLERV